VCSKFKFKEKQNLQIASALCWGFFYVLILVIEKDS